MSSRRVTPVVLIFIALMLTGTAAAAPGDPQVVVDPVDQLWADSIVLAPTDLGKGWRETTTPQESESGSDGNATFCPEANSDQSDLVITGGGSSDFTRGASSVTSFAVLWRTQEHAQANFDRTIAVMPAVQACTAGLLNASFSGIRMTVTANGALQFPAVAPRIAAYRIKLVIRSTRGTKKQRKPVVVTFDTILLGKGRALAWLVVTSYSGRPVSLAKEVSLATVLAARMETDPAGS
jgi:hypothetical protein